MLVAPPHATRAALTVLADAEVFAPEPLGRKTLVVGGGTVLAVLDAPPSLAGLDADTLHLGGARVVPGFVDAHVHVTGGGGEAGPHTAAPAAGLSAYTRAGVTSVVGLLGTDDTTRTTGGLLRRVRALRAEGLSAWAWTGGYHLPPTTLTGAIRSDIAFIREVVGFGELAISDHRSSQPTFDEVARVAADCHVGGLMTGKAGVLHLHVGDGPRGLALVRRLLDETELPPRTLYPTHVNRRRALLDEAFALTERGVTIDVTAFPPVAGAADGPTPSGPDDEVAALDAVAAYLDAGLPPARLTVSSDGGGCLPTFSPQGEVVAMDFATSGALADLVAAWCASGRSLATLLPVVTANPAALLRLPGKGHLAAGADADLVVLGDDHRPRHVMARGRWHVRDGRTVARGLFG